MRVNCEKTRTRRPSSSCLVKQLEEHLVLGRRAHLASRLDRQEARIAAHLTKLHQRVEDRYGRAREAHLLDGASHLRVRGDADALVELALIAEQLDGANELGLGRKLASHLLFHASQHEGSHSSAERRKLVGAVIGVERTKACPELLGAAEKPRHQELEDRPQLFEAVFDRCSGQAKPMLRLERASCSRDQAAPVLDDLRFVEHEIVELCASNEARSAEVQDRS